MVNNASGSVLPEVSVSSGQKNTNLVGKTMGITLLDERSLLACIVRSIPPGSGGRIRISSTLPNRLGKMLALLHWHDYKKKYGKLDDFVAIHLELFVIEGDYIQLREGAQEIIAAMTVVAKVSVAAAASSPYSSLLPSIVVTPMAQSHRLKRAPSTDSNSMKTNKTISKEYVVSTVANSTDNPSHLLEMWNQHSNGACFNIAGGISNVKILSKPKDPEELNGSENPLQLSGMQNQQSDGACFKVAGGISNGKLLSKPENPLELNGPETRLGQLTGIVTVGSLATSDRIGLGGSQSKGSTHRRPSTSFVGKQQGSYRYEDLKKNCCIFILYLSLWLFCLSSNRKMKLDFYVAGQPVLSQIREDGECGFC